MSLESSRFSTNLLLAFTIIFPLAFVPGAAIWPAQTFDDPITASKELFLLLPKLLVLIFAGSLGLLSIRSESKGIWKEIFPKLLLIHLVLVVLSSFNSRDDWAFILMGPNRRLDGLLYQFASVAVSLTAYTVFRKNPKIIQSVLHGLLLVGIIQSITVVASYYKLDPLPSLIYYQPTGHPFEGTLGNYGMLAGILFVSALAGLFIGNQQFKWWHLVAPILMGLGLGIGGNRSALFGMLLAVFLLNLTLRSKRLVLLSALLLLSILGARILPSPLQNWRDIGSLASGESRLQIWRFTLDHLKEIPFSPWLGGGADALRLTQMRNPPLDDPHFVRIYQIELGWKEMPTKVDIYQEPNRPIRSRWLLFHFNEYKGQRDVDVLVPFGIDRAHNMILDRLISYGIFDVIIWVVLFSAAIILLIQRASSLGVFLTAVLLGLGLYYLFWFPVLQVEPIHMLILAAAWALLTTGPSASGRATNP